MRPLKVFLPRFVAVASSVGVWVALAIGPGCQGPDEFFRFSDASQTGAAGTSPAGVAGTMGTGNTTGTAGSGGGPTGVAGAGGNAGGSGGVITGAAGSGAGGTTGAGGGAGTAAPTGGRGGSTGGRGGATGTGSAGTTGTGGAAGSAGGAGGTTGAGGRGGTTGAGGRGGTTGSAGTGGSAGGASGGRGGAGGTGTGGASGGAGGGASPRIQVVAQCQAAMSMQEIKVTFKILNPESVAKQWSDIKVRYYFTPSMQLAPMVTFDFVQKWNASMLTTTVTTSYVEIGFAAGTGTVNGFDNITGSDQIQLHLFNYSTTTWNVSQDDDYSYTSCAGGTSTAYADRLTMPGYYQGQIAWGSEPPL